jgi:CRISPR-associated endonuclease/helicase Cas3
MAVARIPDAFRPGFLDDLLAKSAELGGDTLAEHTWAVLERLADQRRLRPGLQSQADDARLWHRMFWGCFLHDFGKAAHGFQERLRLPQVANPWSEGRHRHEILSLAFADAVFPQGHADRLPVIAVIIAHHKDFDGDPERTILPRYGGRKPDEHQQARVQFLASQLSEDVTEKLWRWLNEYGVLWAQALGFSQNDVEPVSFVSQSLTDLHVRRALADFSTYHLDRKDGFATEEEIRRDMHYRGLILTADHAASAGTPAYPDMQLNMEIANRPLTDIEPNSHQRAVLKTGMGSTILIAPTGSGKTEAALRWAAHQIGLRPTSRLFYTLPYQASMNAMAERLCDRHFEVVLGSPDNQQVTIQHSRATLKLYQMAMDADSGAAPRTAARQARDQQDRARLNFYPVQVFSPYQMLKAAYQLKGYETLLVDYTGALFIFDEIHAYDPERMAMIVTFMGWLGRHFGARFLVMTATLPPMVCEKLDEALPGCEVVEASEETFVESRRHIVHLLDGDVLEQLDRVLDDWQAQRSVLICCNTVARAQAAYISLKERIEALGHNPRDILMLLHGRFNGKDRSAKEQMLMKRVSVGGVRPRPNPMIVVATQVVEVSLNIDLDTIYTDPAPLEALIQRFGRVNRGRGKDAPLLPVHVFRMPLGEKESRPYDHRVVAASLRVLEPHDGQPVDESQVTAMLAKLYEGDIETDWQAAYDRKQDEFQQILNGMLPFKSADRDLEKRFYDHFDGWQVLPTDCYDAYEEAVTRHDYLGASQYLVSINNGQYHMLEGNGRLLPEEEGQYFRQTTVPYDSEFGLDLNRQLAKDDDV